MQDTEMQREGRLGFHCAANGCRCIPDENFLIRTRGHRLDAVVAVRDGSLKALELVEGSAELASQMDFVASQGAARALFTPQLSASIHVR